MTKNITLSISDRLGKKMNEMPEVNWSAVARGCIERYVENRRNPDISPLLEKLQKQKSEEYVKGRRDAETSIDEKGYAEFNIIMNEYNTKVIEAEEMGPDEFGYQPSNSGIMRNVLIRRKILEKEVSDEYLRGLRERLEEIDRLASKGTQ